MLGRTQGTVGTMLNYSTHNLMKAEATVTPTGKSGRSMGSALSKETRNPDSHV